jgi:acyl dehydratase
MPINYDELMQAKATDVPARYGDRETMLYALKTVPTMATVIGWGATNTLARSNINYMMVVHGEQRLTLHKPLPDTADVLMDEHVAGVFDKGAGKGAIIITERTVREKNSNAKLCTLQTTIFARGDGGFGGPKDGAPEPHTLPTRAPDLTHEADTRPDQAFLYALSGDRNPLHRDPNFAKMAGFPRPILHGLCTYGTACRSVISTVCKFDPTKITSFDARFSSPVFPGETIVTEMWVDGNVLSFRCKLKERDVVVLNNGKCILAA